MPPPESARLDADTLNAFYAERLIGRLRYEAKEQLYSFEYDEAWRNDVAAFDLAPLLPKNEGTHAGTAVRFFFSNLLPEGEMLEIVSRTHGVSKYDPFGLLRKIGAECAGALKILESETAAPDGKTYRPISAQALSESARVDAGNFLANVGGKLRMSLAGVQDKLPALFAANGNVFIPEVGSASTHILKPNNRALADVSLYRRQRTVLYGARAPYGVERAKVYPHCGAGTHLRRGTLRSRFQFAARAGPPGGCCRVARRTRSPTTPDRCVPTSRVASNAEIRGA